LQLAVLLSGGRAELLAVLAAEPLSAAVPLAVLLASMAVPLPVAPDLADAQAAAVVLLAVLFVAALPLVVLSAAVVPLAVPLAVLLA